MKFNYQARTKEGEMRTGQIEAFSKEAAIAILQKYGLYPTFIEETKVPFYAKEVPFFKKISAKDLVIATRELAIMFRSGVPFVEAINTVAQESQNSKMKEIFLEIAREVKGGTPFSAALGRYPEIFSSFYISMVKIGEISGRLPQALENVAEYMERNYYFTSRIRGAFLYPIIVILFVIVVIFLIFFFVVPKLTEFITSLGGELPLSARIFLTMGSFLKNWGIPFAVFLSGIIGALVGYAKSPKGKEELGRVSLNLPFFGSFLRAVYLSRLGQTLATLIAAGVHIAQALEVSSEIVGQNIYKEAILSAKETVQGGENLSTALKRYPNIFPPFFSEMTAVGEKSGNLSRSLLSISNFYEKELERRIETLSTILEPMLIIFVGTVVGILIVTIFSTVYSTISVIGTL